MYMGHYPDYSPLVCNVYSSLVDLLCSKVLLLFIFFLRFLPPGWLFQMILLFSMCLSVCLVGILKVKELLAKMKVLVAKHKDNLSLSSF